MAQQQGSFLYRLKLMLDGDEAVQNLGLKMENVKKQVRELGTGVGQAEAKVEKMVNSFESAPRAMQPLTREVNEANQSLEEMAASATRSWGRVEQGALEASEGAQRLSQSIVRGSERAEQSMKQLAAQQSRVRGTTFSLGSTASSTASQLSIDLTQSAQDAAFGLENLAASAPFLQEQFGRLRKESASFTGALGKLGGAFMGPTGVIAAFTLLLTFKDQIISFFEDVSAAMTGASTEAEAFQETIVSIKDDLVEVSEEDIFKTAIKEGEAGGQFGRILSARLASINERIRRAEEVQQRLQKQRENLDPLSATVAQSSQNMETLARNSSMTVEQIQRAVESGEELRGATGAVNEILRANTQESKEFMQTYREISNIGGDVSEGVQRDIKNLEGLRQKRENLQDVLSSMNIESLRRVEVKERLAEATEAEGEQLRKLTDAYLELEEQKEKTNEESEKTLKYQQLLRELRVESMEEGLEKQIAQIEASTQARREEIKALDLDKEDKLLKLLRESAELQKERAFEESVTLPEPDDTGGMPLMIRNPTDTGPAFIPVENATDQVKKAQQKMNERLNRDREALRDERSFGATRGALEELGSMQIQFQLDMMEKEENLRLKRLKKQRDFIRTRADIQEILGNQSEADRLNEEANKINSEIASVEDKWYDKRLQKQQEFLGKQVRNIETTPLGEAYKGLFLDVGGVLKTFYSDSLNWQKKNMAERASIIGQAGTQVVGAVENIATQSFNSWLSVRQEELKAEGKSQEQRTEIIKKEGKRRFQFMKAMQIAEASIAGLTGAINAYVAGTNLSKAGVPAPIPHIVGLSLMGASLSATGAKISKIAGMSIGDKLSGSGGGGGGGARGGQFTQRAAASSATAAGRVGTAMDARRNNNEDQIKETAERVGEEVGKQMPDRVTMDDDTAERANDAAVAQKDKLNK
jgi:uncharacterized protein YoxC